MKTPKSVKNTVTGRVFTDLDKNLLDYAKSDTATFLIIYDEEESEPEEKSYTEEQLKALSMKDLQTLAEDLDCDKRRKDSLIDAILNKGR